MRVLRETAIAADIAASIYVDQCISFELVMFDVFSENKINNCSETSSFECSRFVILLYIVNLINFLSLERLIQIETIGRRFAQQTST